MIKHYIIDGNNLIGKIKELWELQSKDKQASRERLAFMLDRYFGQKNFTVTLHFDGFPGEAIRTSKIRIVYSEKRTADSRIKEEIDHSKNPKLIAVVSSDTGIKDFAKVNSCKTIKSEGFAAKLKADDNSKTEESIIKSIAEDEIKKIFGVDE